MSEIVEKILQVGDIAPQFKLPSATGEIVTLTDLIKSTNKGVVVFFYPRAMTPGCVTEACDFRDSEIVLKQAGYTVVGISPDTPAKLIQFADKYELLFPLLSDESRAVMNTYGVWGEKKNYGKIVQGVIRSTFVIKTDGTIDRLWRNVKATGHVGRVCRELGIGE